MLTCCTNSSEIPSTSRNARQVLPGGRVWADFFARRQANPRAVRRATRGARVRGRRLVISLCGHAWRCQKSRDSCGASSNLFFCDAPPRNLSLAISRFSGSQRNPMVPASSWRHADCATLSPRYACSGPRPAPLWTATARWPAGMAWPAAIAASTASNTCHALLAAQPARIRWPAAARCPHVRPRGLWQLGWGPICGHPAKYAEPLPDMVRCLGASLSPMASLSPATVPLRRVADGAYCGPNCRGRFVVRAYFAIGGSRHSCTWRELMACGVSLSWPARGLFSVLRRHHCARGHTTHVDLASLAFAGTKAKQCANDAARRCIRVKSLDAPPAACTN